ncbi:MAG: hypothetical protein WAX67_11405 [Rugosibacter sp.]
MPECPSPSAISQWLPVVGALLGATLGFLGGLLNLQLTHKNKESAERESRERNRLESLYETLVEIQMDYRGLLGEMISKVHFNTPPKPREYSGIPPLIKLDMVIHMYFPGLVEAHKKLASALEPLGQKLAENISTSFSGHSTQEKQKICGEYLTLIKEISSEISNLQRQLAGMAKA